MFGGRNLGVRAKDSRAMGILNQKKSKART